MLFIPNKGLINGDCVWIVTVLRTLKRAVVPGSVGCLGRHWESLAPRRRAARLGNFRITPYLELQTTTTQKNIDFCIEYHHALLHLEPH